jgi:hypothetical protein
VRGGQCGVSFERPLQPRELDRLRWIVEHEGTHVRNSLGSATAVWR